MYPASAALAGGCAQPLEEWYLLRSQPALSPLAPGVLWEGWSTSHSLHFGIWSYCSLWNAVRDDQLCFFLILEKLLRVWYLPVAVRHGSSLLLTFFGDAGAEPIVLLQQRGSVPATGALSFIFTNMRRNCKAHKTQLLIISAFLWWFDGD